jgi:hypothetical protein
MGPPPTSRGRFGARWWPSGQATWPAGQVERPPPTFSTDSGFSSSCRRVATKVQVKPPQTLADRPRSWASRPDHLPNRPRVRPTCSTCQIHPHGDDDFDIWSTSLDEFHLRTLSFGRPHGNRGTRFRYGCHISTMYMVCPTRSRMMHKIIFTMPAEPSRFASSSVTPRGYKASLVTPVQPTSSRTISLCFSASFSTAKKRKKKRDTVL